MASKGEIILHSENAKRLLILFNAVMTEERDVGNVS